MNCPLCNRPFGRTKGSHHLIPKSRKGKETVAIHVLCHRQIHALFTEKELERSYNTIEKLRAHPEIQKFITWVSNKDPDFLVAMRMKK